MREALRLVSWQGYMKERVSAVDVTSKDDARKRGPFVDPESERPVYWVNWGTRSDSDKKIRAHFKNYPSREGDSPWDSLASLRRQVAALHRETSESPLHRKAADTVCAVLNGMIGAGKPLTWKYLDKNVSDFLLEGDLLANAVRAETERYIDTPFGVRYRLDVAVIGKTPGGEEYVCGGVELELSHRFEATRALVLMPLGFPLFSVDLSALHQASIDERWAARVLAETSLTATGKKRGNYLYVHDMLYPVFLNVPDAFRYQNRHQYRHQYLIFVDEDSFNTLTSRLKELKKSLGLDKEVLVQVRNGKNPEELKKVQRVGQIVGSGWQHYHGTKCIVVVLDTEGRKTGNLYAFALLLTNILNTEFETLVGYNWTNGTENKNPNEPLWLHEVYQGHETHEWDSYRIAPKRLSAPIHQAVRYFQAHRVKF